MFYRNFTVMFSLLTASMVMDTVMNELTNCTLNCLVVKMKDSLSRFVKLLVSDGLSMVMCLGI